MGDAKKCAYCGGPFTPLRSTGMFCTPTHRKSYFKTRKRRERQARESAQRAGMFLDFDGRTSGQVREGFGARLRVSRQLRRDPYRVMPPPKRKDEEEEVA
jgi:hypothetical protein